jgi:16S rRNA (uracil1498-N3)-methyltransferase
MVERQHRPALSVYAPERLVASATIDLPEAAAHHARVRRVDVGDPVVLTDGQGMVANGTVAVLGKSRVSVAIDAVRAVPPPSPLHLLVPVADRERMLLAAEKCVELQVSSWRPVLWARSRSVSPRGEGDKFREKVTARMIAALEQSGGAWLPMVHPESEPGDALGGARDAGTRLILDIAGGPLPPLSMNDAVALAVGPEGGFDPDELAQAANLGWARAALGASTLRFETALIAATAVIRARQHQVRS